MAATDLERLVVQLSADITKYERSLAKAQGTTNKRLNAIQKKAGKTGAAFGALGGKIAAAFAVAGGARGLKNLLDATTRIDNALKVAGLSGEELEVVYGRLRDSAIKSAAPLESLVELYGRAALVQKELGVSSSELLGFTDSIAVALRVSGKSAAESSGALLQLSQALGSGVVRAEEFNSILEGALPIAQAAAAGLDEAGGSVSKLRQLVVEGKISSEAFFRAFEAGAPILEEKVKDAALTTGQSMENIKTALIDAAREFAKGSLAAEDLAAAFQEVADYINSIDFNAFGEEVRKLVGYIDEIKAALDFVSNLGANIGEATGLNKLGELATGGAIERRLGPLSIKSDSALQKRIDAAFAGAVDTAGGLTEDAIRRSAGQVVNQSGKTNRIERTKEIAPVSISDFAPPSASKSGGSSSKKQSDFQREIEQIKERTAALKAETAALSQRDPLIEDYGYTLEKASVAQDLLAAAQKSGLAVGKEVSSVQQLLNGDFSNLTPKARDQAEAMLTLSEAQAVATVESEKLAEKQKNLVDAVADFKETSKSMLSGFISDLRQGKSATEALEGALNKVLDKVIDIAINSAFDPKSGGGGFFSQIGNLFGLGGGGGFKITPGAGLFDKGGYTGNGGRLDPAGVVHKGEYVFDQDSVKAAGGPGVLDALRSRLKGYANGGSVGSAPRLPTMRAAANGNSEPIRIVVGVTKDGELQAYVQNESAKVSAKVVQVSTPGIIQKSTTAVGGAIGSGRYDSSMANYGVSRQAKVR